MTAAPVVLNDSNVAATVALLQNLSVESTLRTYLHNIDTLKKSADVLAFRILCGAAATGYVATTTLIYACFRRFIAHHGVALVGAIGVVAFTAYRIYASPVSLHKAYMSLMIHSILRIIASKTPAHQKLTVLQKQEQEAISILQQAYITKAEHITYLATRAFIKVSILDSAQQVVRAFQKKYDDGSLAQPTKNSNLTGHKLPPNYAYHQQLLAPAKQLAKYNVNRFVEASDLCPNAAKLQIAARYFAFGQNHPSPTKPYLNVTVSSNPTTPGFVIKPWKQENS